MKGKKLLCGIGCLASILLMSLLLVSCGQKPDMGEQLEKAIGVGDTTYHFYEGSYNNERITYSGVYLYDSSYSSLSTPESKVDRVDLVVMDDTVVYIGEKNTRNMMPTGGGVVVTFAGNTLEAIEELKVGDSVQTTNVDTAKLPDQYVRINDTIYAIDKNNATRAPEGVTALYTPEFGASTKANKYGVEIAIEDGKVTAVEVAKGDMAIPENGCVLSMHSDCALYDTATKVNVGDEAVVSLGGHNYSYTKLELSGINSTRYEDTLIVYRDREKTGTNAYGYEIQIDENGKMVGESYSGDMEVPKGGYVLSGHGKSKEALANAYQYGAEVQLDLRGMQVVMITTPSTLLFNAEQQLEQIVLKLEQAKENLLYLDYATLESEIDELESDISEAKSAFKACDFEQAMDMIQKSDETCGSLQYAMIESHPVENRAVWYRSKETSDEEVRATVEKMKTLGINTIYLETWYNGRFIGYSDNPLIAHSVLNGSYDAMEGFVRICHENDIEVHAWVENFFVGTVESQEQTNQALADHFAGRWLIDRQGKNTFYYGSSNTNFIFLNPYDKEARKLLVDFYREIITKYEVDGIHLDYIRFPELNYGKDDFGYNENIVSAWQKENNTDVDPATLKNGELHDSWITFRQEIINSFVGEVYGMICDTDPSIWLSAAVYPGIPDIKNDIFQDCENWVQKGYMDELFSMSYGADNTYVSNNAAKFVELAGEACFYSTGISAFGETAPVSFALQLTEVTGKGADGVAIFSLANINATNYQSEITEGAFRNASVQVYDLNETVEAQLTYILEKAKTVYIPYAGLAEKDYQSLCALLQPIIDKAAAFDADAATWKQQLEYCQTTKTELASAMETAKTYFKDSSKQEKVLADFEELISWLTKSETRIDAKFSARS